jgi:hypothetical protein
MQGMGILHDCLPTVCIFFNLVVPALIQESGCGLVGQYPLSVLDIGYEPEHARTLNERITPTLRYQLQLHRIEMRCCTAMQEIGLRNMTKDREKTLEIILRSFEAQLKDLESEATTGMDALTTIMWDYWFS